MNDSPKKKRVLKKKNPQGAPSFIQKFTSTYFKYKTHKKRPNKKINKNDANHSFCIDVR